MGEESDLEITLEDEVNEEEDIVVVEDNKGVKMLNIVNGGINDAYWNKSRQAFLPTMGIDGMMSIDETIKSSIALLFEVDDSIYLGSLFLRLQGAVVSGSSVLTKEHLSKSTKRTAYYALTTMHGYGLFPRGFVYLCINLFGQDRAKIKKALEPLKKLSSEMKEQLTQISKCEEKRVSKNRELHAKCVKMQVMVDKEIIWQYPSIFEGMDKWPEFVMSAVRHHDHQLNNITGPKDERTKEDRYAKERKEKLKGKMATLQSSYFWLSNTTVWGMDTVVDGVQVVETAIKFIREINTKLYQGELIEKVRTINAKTIPLEDRHIYDQTRQHSLRFLEIIERYSVFPKGIIALIIKSIMANESVITPILDLLGKMVGPVEKILDRMVKMASDNTTGKSIEKDADISLSLVNLRIQANNVIYPRLPSFFANLGCTRVPGYVAEWMKKSPMTKSAISEWSKQMGVETDLNGFPLRTNEEFIMPEMEDEYMIEDDEVKKKKKKGKTKGGKEEKELSVKKEPKGNEGKKKERALTRPLPHPDCKPISLMAQVISNPFEYPPPGPPLGLPPPFMPMMGMGMGPPPFPMGNLTSPISHFTGGFNRPGPPALLDLPIAGPPIGIPPSFMGIRGMPDISIPPPKAEEDEEKRQLENMAKLVMGMGEGRREDNRNRGERTNDIRNEDEMVERERRLQRWLEEKNGGRRRDERRKRSRSRSRSRDRVRDGKYDFERRVEELERRRKEENEVKERNRKEACVEHWRKVKGSFKSMDESKWEFRAEWGVTTVWRRVSGHSKWEEKVKDQLELISIKINDYFVNNVQTGEDEEKKKIVMDRLQDGIQMKLDSSGVFFLMAGSSPSSFASKTSNLDLVLISPIPTMSPEHIRDIFFQELPYVIMQRGGTITRHESLWMEFDCTMGGNKLGVRIAVDSGAYYFSKIMSIYDKIDKRVSPLLHYIKHWTATHLRRADDISKYLLTNLVIHFLQSGVSPPILPCLHILYPARLTPDNFSSFDYVSPFDPPLPQCTNTQSLASLFIGFLMYYASFDFSRYAISIRTGTVIRKRDLGVSLPEFAVEHPFDGSYSAVVNDPFTSSHFTAAMAAACQDAITSFGI